MPITKATASSVAPAAKGDLVVGSATNDAAVLGVGSADQVLTVDSSTTTGLKWAAAPAASRNFTLVNAGGTALTGANTITVSGISNADEIFVLIDGASSSSVSEIRLRLNGDTGSNYFQYGPTYVAGSSYAASNFRMYSSVNNLIILGTLPAVASGVLAGYVRIVGCNTSGQKMFQVSASGNAQGSSDQEAYFTGGRYNSSSTISSVSILCQNGNFDAGTVWVYKSA